MRANLLRLLALVLAASMVLGACGGSDSDTDADASGDASSSTTAAAEEEEETDPAADKAAAKKIVLTSADVGPGYKEQPQEDDEPADGSSTTSTTVDPNEEAFKKCAGGGDFFTSDDDERQAESSFTNETTQGSISSTATYAASTKDIEPGFEAISSDKFLGCMDEALKAAIAEEIPDGQGSITSIKTSRVALDLPTERETAFQTVLDISAGGQSVKAYLDFALFNEGRVVGGIFTTGFNEAFPAAEREKLVKLMAGRVKDAG